MRQLLWISIFFISATSVLSDECNYIPALYKLFFQPSRKHVKVIKTTELFNAIHSADINVTTIIKILTSFKIEQHDLLKKKYAATHGISLLNDLRNNLLGLVDEKLIVAYLTPKNEYLAKNIYKSIRAIGSDKSLLIDTLCLSNTPMVNWLKNTYVNHFHQSISRDIKKYTVDNFQRLMLSCTAAVRDKKTHIVNKIYSMFQSEHQDLIDFYGTKSFASIKHSADDFFEEHKTHIETFIKHNFSGDTQRAIIAIIRYAKSPARYFSERFHKILENKNNIDYQSLIYLVIMDKSVSINEIKKTYKTYYQADLYEIIESRTTESFGQLLINILNK